MLNLSELENIHADIQAVHEIVHSLKARIDGKEVVIRILKNSSGHYFYETSHVYRGADNTTPERSFENRFTSVQEAASEALRFTTRFYRSTDEGGRWVENEDFLH